MGKSYLIAVDIEGVHGIVGEPFKTATEAFDYDLALKNAAKEANAIAKALFDSGAEKVAVWANHGSPNNLAYEDLDPRVEIIPRNTQHLKKRYYFIEGSKKEYDGQFLIGYHAREGSLGGVLAHTYSSVSFQYFKLNGKYVGEVEYDSYIAGTMHGFPTLLVGSDNVCCGQIKETLPDTYTVVTKYGKSRNTADLIDSETVLADFYNTTLEAVKNPPAPITMQFPCDLEIRVTRMEEAARKLEKYLELGLEAAYGEDCHIIKIRFYNIEQMQYVLFI